MGYSLELYSLDWKRLGKVFGSKDQTILNEILGKSSDLFVGNPGTDLNWQDALGQFVQGNHRHRITQNPVTWTQPGRVSPAESLALVGIVRHMGERLGEIIHASRSGPDFRRIFEPASLKNIMGASELMPYLLDRPLLNLSQQDYPFWGGLNRAELELLNIPRSDQALRITHPDYESWVYDLLSVMSQARNSGTDLVTLYL